MQEKESFRNPEMNIAQGIENLTNEAKESCQGKFRRPAMVCLAAKQALQKAAGHPSTAPLPIVIQPPGSKEVLAWSIGSSESGSYFLASNGDIFLAEDGPDGTKKVKLIDRTHFRNLPSSEENQIILLLVGMYA